MLVKNFSRRHFEIFFSYFSQKLGSDISGKLSPQETIFKKCQRFFSGKKKKISPALSNVKILFWEKEKISPALSNVKDSFLGKRKKYHQL